MHKAARDAALRALARELDGVDADVYRRWGRDPTAPILEAGSPDARIGVFGRDPGATEVELGLPFVGAGGQKVRAGLHRALLGGDPPDLAASIAAGERVFWANTVPFKPIGNKAWPTAVKRRFQPLIADLLVHAWRGADLLVMGQDALRWFGLADREVQAAIDDLWSRDDRFEASLEVPVRAPDGAERRVRLHPLPHPSPLNATWSSRFPALLDARLARLGLAPTRWRADVSVA
jgi:uracil-DNA glycosylase